MNTKKSQVRSNEPFHMRHRNFFVGIFLFVPLILLPILLVGTLSKMEWVEKWCKDITVVYDNKTGLSKSSSVVFQGVSIGRIEDVSLNDRGHIVVKFKIKQRYTALIKKDSKARLAQKSMFVGDPMIELTKGSDYAPPLMNGDTLMPEYPADLSGTIAQLTDVVSNLQVIIKGIAEGKGSVGQLLTNDTLFRQILRDTRHLDATLAQADKMLKDLDKTVLSFDAVGKSGASLVDSLGGTLARVNGLVGNLDSLLVNVQKLPEGVARTMDGVQRDLGETETLLKAVQKHWLIRKQVKQVREEEKK